MLRLPSAPRPLSPFFSPCSSSRYCHSFVCVSLCLNCCQIRGHVARGLTRGPGRLHLRQRRCVWISLSLILLHRERQPGEQIEIELGIEIAGREREREKRYSVCLRFLLLRLLSSSPPLLLSSSPPLLLLLNSPSSLPPCRYMGSFVASRRQGSGTFKYANGDVFIGKKLGRQKEKAREGEREPDGTSEGGETCLPALRYR